MFHFLTAQLLGSLEVFFPMSQPLKPSFAITYIAFLLKKCLYLVSAYNSQLFEI